MWSMYISNDDDVANYKKYYAAVNICPYVLEGTDYNKTANTISRHNGHSG